MITQRGAADLTNICENKQRRGFIIIHNDHLRHYCNECGIDAGVYFSFSCLDRASRVVGISQESRVLLVVRVIRASIRRIPNVCGELQ